MVEIIAVCLAAFVGLLIVVGFYFLVAGIISWPVMWAWNYGVVHVFTLPELNYWQSFSLVFLLCIISGAFRSNFSTKGK